MNSDELSAYKQQLEQVNQALLISSDEVEKSELCSLKNSIQELLSLSNDDSNERSTSNDELSDEFALFMDEMEKEGAVQKKNFDAKRYKFEIPKDIEGKKCRAPHQHQWGDIVYHNAMICSVVSDYAEEEDNELKVRVLFTNPTHQEMLPCPYYFESDCKFSEEKCRFSHGEVIPYSSIQEYIEPKFELLKIGSRVLAKQKSNIWIRAKIRRIYEDKCLVRFENDKKQVELNFEHVLPLDNNDNPSEESSNSDDSDIDDSQEIDRDDVINRSLLITPSEQALGDWEKYTKGMGSKLMTKMGYITGTGLGKNADGRTEPVGAVVLPLGKSLDHCMKLREQAGGDKNLFSVEKKLLRLQKKQEKRNQSNYKKNSENNSVFNLINKSLEGAKGSNSDMTTERQKIKQECSRNLNIKSLQIEDSINQAERNLGIIKESLTRHTDVTSVIHLQLKNKLAHTQDQLKMYQSQAVLIRNEQSSRTNKKKMTVF